MNKIGDPDVRKLAEIAGELKADYVRDGDADPWADSPFAWIRTRPSRRRGAIGERLVERWCSAHGLKVSKSPDSQADRVIEGKLVEIKFSTLWQQGVYKFQQIRNQNYEFVICLGISPFDAHCWVISKEVALKHASPQHAGKGGQDTFWLSFPAAAPPAWLKPCGGSLADALKIMKGWGKKG